MAGICAAVAKGNFDLALYTSMAWVDSDPLDPPAAAAPAPAAGQPHFVDLNADRRAFATVGKTPCLRPTDDSDRGEGVQVLAVERNGLRRYAVAEIMRNGETATLGPWVLKRDVPSGWLLELLEEGHSDRAPVVEPRPRASRAHDAVSMLRTILRFGFALRYPDCAALVERLKMVRFENAGGREQASTQ